MKADTDTIAKLYAVLDHIAGLQLENRQKEIASLHQRALHYENVERLPIVFSYPPSPDQPFQPLKNREIYQSDAAMMYNELVSAWDTSISSRSMIGDDLPITIRPNWGTVLVASLLGYEPEQRDDQNPWIKREGRRPITLDQVVETGTIIDIAKAPWISKVQHTYAFFHKTLKQYPELKNIVTITQPDLQGPFDTLEQVMGADLFIAMVLNPEKVHEALLAVAGLQIACRKIFQPYCTEKNPGFCHQHGMLVRGNILIRNDSVVMISEDMYAEIVSPADQKVLQAAGGGGIHSCGKIDHAFKAMICLEAMQAFDFGQSYMNDIDRLYAEARRKKIPLIRVQPEEAELVTGSVLTRFPTGVSLMYHASSFQEARKLCDQYRNAAERLP